MKTEQHQDFSGHRVRIELVRETPARELPSTYARVPEDVARIVGDLAVKDREHFAVVLLNTKNRVLGVDVVSVGTLDAALVHAREVFKSAILSNAAAVILTHNHPSGDPTPSAEDLRITRTLQKVGEIIGIQVLDHVIVCDGSHMSLCESGLL